MPTARNILNNTQSSSNSRGQFDWFLARVEKGKVGELLKHAVHIVQKLVGGEN